MDFKAASTKEERLEATRHLVKAFGQKKGQRSVNKEETFVAVLRIRIRDPEPL
jgi:hypothetical protein